MSCGVGHRHSVDLALLWLCCRLAGVVPIRPLAWELPYAADVTLKSKEKEKERKKLPRKGNKKRKRVEKSEERLCDLWNLIVGGCVEGDFPTVL